MVGVPLVLGSTAFCWYRVWSCSKEWALGVRSSIVCGVVVEEERCASHWLVSEETCARSIHAKVSIKVIAQRRRRHGCAVEEEVHGLRPRHALVEGCGSPRYIGPQGHCTPGLGCSLGTAYRASLVGFAVGKLE